MKKANEKKNDVQVKGAANNVTELVFILDKSGSMAGLESDTVGGFNAMIDKQRKGEGEVLVTTVLFSNDSETLHDRVKIADVAPLGDKDYQVGGCTALIDAIGGTIEHIESIHRYARAEDVPAHTMFVITTDGLENASRRFTADKVKKTVEKKKKAGWEFLFLGANIDAVETARHFGIDRDHAVEYCCDSVGTAKNYGAMNKAFSAVRNAVPLACAQWKAEVEEDLANRKNRKK